MKKNLLLTLIACLIITVAGAQNNYVLNFNGTSNYVNLGTTAGNNLRTIECWFKPAINITSSTLSEPASLIDRNTNATGETGEFSIFIGPNDWTGYEGKIVFGVSGNPHNVFSNSSTWQAGVWHHLACVINPSAGMEMYIDGQKQTSTYAYTYPTDNRTEITTFGCWGDLNDRFFNGALDEIRFWNRALSQSEIQQKMCLRLNPATENGLVGYWTLDEGAGTIIYDSTTNNYYGSIYGATYNIDNSFCFYDVEEYQPECSVTVFPNPFNNSTVIQLSNTLDNAQISIHNIIGQELKTIQNITKDKITINRENLRNGIYFLHLTSNNRTIVIKKLIISD
ncbi:MAG TPA: T9SS type A sorting domain-containing protein [Bacteroidales bacterium]|nr:T9SS type A sorting domain-containing protein [Bacteroidales bacterium]HQI69464.1 T9SS type A sorting domain-containing protein [Bacteroidales bacterium]